ncbi:Cna B-type domain-containing protein, partial [Gemella cuniculi]
NQDGKRPSKIKVKLLADGKEVATKEVTEKDGWKYSFDNLDKYKEGKEIKYTIDEGIVEFYQKTVNGFNLTNKYTPEKTKVEGIKTWEDNNNQDGKRPSKIKVKLLADGKEVATKEVTEKDGWKYSFDNLDKYKEGKEIKYTIDEEIVEFYQKTVNGFNLTNKYTPEKTKVEGTKTWEDNNNQDGKRPSKIKVKLLADGEVIQEKEVTKENGWKYSFENLDKYKDGKEIKYTIDEEIVEFYQKTVDGFNLTNKYTPEKTKVEGTKTWEDNNNQDGKRPSKIKVKLLADGEVIQEKEVTEKDGWKYSFENLDKFKNGKEIKYTIDEEIVEFYQKTVNGFNLTNKYTPEKTKVEGTKTWEDNNNQDGKRPSKIKVKLLADGKEVATKEVTEKDGWKYSFDNLDKYKEGKEIKYTIDEGIVEFYQKTVNGFNLTNKYTPEKTKVEGAKTWEDNNNQDGKRPSKIKVKLLADGKVVKEKEVTEKDGWKYSFDNLDKYKDGKEIKYTIDEERVVGYQTIVKGYNLTNRLLPPPPTPRLPRTGLTDSGLGGVGAIISVLALFVIGRKKYLN